MRRREPLSTAFINRFRNRRHWILPEAQTFSLAYFFTTPQALKTFEDTNGFEVGAGLDFAVADLGASGKSRPPACRSRS
jgi:hypothetical protein